MYDRTIHPANLWLDNEPGGHAEVDDIYRANITRLVQQGTYTEPAQRFPGARYFQLPGYGDIDALTNG